MRGGSFVDGTAQIVFDFVPQAGDMFDLISLSVGNGFGGTSFDLVNVVGLPEGLSASAGIVAGSMANQIFRATIVDTTTPGDFNDDGIVDGADFLVWQRDPSVGALSDWEANFGLALATSLANVPEPTALALALTALCVVGIGRHCLALGTSF